MVTLRSRYLLVLISIFVALATAAPGYAQSAENVAVVINESSPASVRIGEYYIANGVSPPAVNTPREMSSSVRALWTMAHTKLVVEGAAAARWPHYFIISSPRRQEPESWPS